jgi:hypothetical protein
MMQLTEVAGNTNTDSNGCTRCIQTGALAYTQNTLNTILVFTTSYNNIM